MIDNLDNCEFVDLIEDDLDALVALEMEVFPEDWYGKSQLRAELSAGCGVGLFVGERLVAYALMRGCGRVVDITRLGVSTNYQGRGVGSRLLQTILERSSYDYHLLCVRKINKGALHLYLREGFKVVGTVASSWVMLRQ